MVVLSDTAGTGESIPLGDLLFFVQPNGNHWDGRNYLFYDAVFSSPISSVTPLSPEGEVFQGVV
jgi:hypothetical protein